MSGLPEHELRRLRAVAADDGELAGFVARRVGGEPLQYIEGSAPFGPFDLVVDDRVLVPRPETEGLWELAASLVDDPRVVVDLCTGSGAVAIALASSFPGARVVGTDLSGAALDVARMNGATHAPAVEWSQGDLFGALDSALAGRIDLVVSNPPYVAAAEWAGLPDDVRREPHVALVAGPTGFEVLARIATESVAWLAPGGLVVCEIGETQGAEAAEIFAAFGSIRIVADLSGRDRYLVAGT
ncbi:MAG TPA: peptide chain release factor N(5)-glutamine methyltransferase [Acidimicrobiia bacterium]|nr:peptide chain release factor N(5)-glutamine methyltransferase [Acidimicrobiia bacterium]